MKGWSIRSLLRDYRTRKRQPREVLEMVYASLEKHGTVPAWISVHPFEYALAQLEKAQKNVPEGPLFGIPFAVKDNIDVAGLPTTAACPEFAYTPSRHAEVVERLVRAGAIVIGKTNLDQFATGLVGTRTPYGICSSVFDERYISGGSSSGSAVTVARGDVAFALGTDTAGSGRVPAGFNGLVGVKPTRGLLSTRGVLPACRSLDCVSVFARDLDDAELVLEVAAGYDAEDAYSRDAPALPAAVGARPRIGVPTGPSLEFFGDEESAALFAAAVRQLESSACELVPVDLTPFRETASLLYLGPWLAERWAAVGDFVVKNPEAVHPVIRQTLQAAPNFSASDAFVGAYRLAALKRRTERVWATIDALIVPTAPTHYRIDEVLAEPLKLNQNLGTYTNFVNLLDLAALAIPAGFRGNGLPFGVTLIGPAFTDARLLELGRRMRNERTQHHRPRAGCVWLAVAGAHLSGQPLNHELVSRGARLVRSDTTAAEYRLYALRTNPPKPGLVHTPHSAQGSGEIELEIWELTEEAFGSFVAEIPAPMTIGSTKLRDGSLVKGFSCEPHALDGAEDITACAGWRAYLSERRGES